MIAIFQRETPCNRRPLDRLSSREHYYETRTENLIIYRSIFSFNLSMLSRTWSPTSVRNLSTSWQTIGTKVQISISVSPSCSCLDDGSSRIGQSRHYWSRTAMGKRAASARNRWAPKTNLSYQNVFLSTTPLPELPHRPNKVPLRNYCTFRISPLRSPVMPRWS